MSRTAAAFFALLLAQTSGPPAQQSETLAGRTVMEAVEGLKPGEFLWMPQAAPSGPVLIMINRSTQRAVVYRNGVPIGVTTVSTGRPGFPTPTGVYVILEKDEDHRSNLYEDAPMPYMQRLTWRGVALHAGHVPGWPASHGCIRLPHEFARALFGVTRLGGTVIVTDALALPRLVPHGPTIDIAREPGGGGVIWQPEPSPKGPVSIVLSLADQRMIVLRNGVEIGASPFALTGRPRETAVYTLNADGLWVRVPLPGQSDDRRTVTREDRARFTAPAAFRTALAQVVRPGTTVVMTVDSLKRRSSQPTALLEEDK